MASALSNLVKLDRHKKDDYNDQIFFNDVKFGIACGLVPGAVTASAQYKKDGEELLKKANDKQRLEQLADSIALLREEKLSWGLKQKNIFNGYYYVALLQGALFLCIWYNSLVNTGCLTP